MDSPIIINWTSPLSFLGAAGVLLKILFHFSIEIPVSKQNSLRWDAAVLRRHIWGYTVYLCPPIGKLGLNELMEKIWTFRFSI